MLRSRFESLYADAQADMFLAKEQQAAADHHPVFCTARVVFADGLEKVGRAGEPNSHFLPY